MLPRKPFITGSHAYGEPNSDSDIDLVVLVDVETVQQLLAASENVDDHPVRDSDGGATRGSFRFGGLNLICVTDEVAFDCWKDGTDFLKTKAPVTREQAVKYFRKKRERLGVK